MHPSGKRQAGILIPAFSPRREGDLGIGDTRALRGWIDWAADHGVSFIQLLPIHENGMEESPYSAISSAALDPVYLTIEEGEIPGLWAAEIARVRHQLGPALESAWIDYPAVRRAKRELLEIAWSRFDMADQTDSEEFTQFREEESAWLVDYCEFRWLMEQHGESLTWDQWPESSATPQKARDYIAKMRLCDGAAIDGRLGFFAFVQWLGFRQWRAVRAHADLRHVKLMGDVPIGINWHSSDVFFQSDAFHLNWCAGSPPEGGGQENSFFQQWGQNWGVPLYRWDSMKTNGFSWWQARITRLTAIFQIFRLDHILGFYRIYAFPWRPERNREFLGLTQTQAAELTGGRLPRWFPRPDDTDENKAANRADGELRLRAILTASRGAEVIAEDLGWVPDYVRPHLADLGLAGFRIPHWDCDAFGHPAPAEEFPEHSFAAYSTHDHDPVNGIWRGCLRVIQEHRERPTSQSAGKVGGAEQTLRILSEFAGIPIPDDGVWPAFTEGIRLRLITALFESNSRYAALAVTELFGLDERINEPGTTGGRNWCFRLPWTLKQIAADPLLDEPCRKLAVVIHLTGRAPE
jgi:4-alpha-glucanotransferase